MRKNVLEEQKIVRMNRRENDSTCLTSLRLEDVASTEPVQEVAFPGSRNQGQDFD